MACARTVAVVVPSPATSLVLLAASLRSCAPMFSNGSSSSISLAMVTPSLHTCGGPNFLSSTTFRPRGPSVTPTVLAIWSMPRFMAARASSLKVNCFGIVLLFHLFSCSTGPPRGGIATLGAQWRPRAARHYFLKRMSSSRSTRYSISPSLYSVPAYLE